MQENGSMREEGTTMTFTKYFADGELGLVGEHAIWVVQDTGCLRQSAWSIWLTPLIRN